MKHLDVNDAKDADLIEVTGALDFEGPESLEYPGYEDEWLERPIFERFENCARRNPDRVAIRDQKGSATYGEVLTECLRIAGWIELNLSRNEPVAIGLAVDRHYPIAMLAALAAGRPYVPLDLSHPTERLRHILHQCGTHCVLTDDGCKAVVADCLPPNVKLFLKDEIENTSAPSHGQLPGTPDDVAYIIYTSGSSGTPKGVYQNQRGLTHDVLQYTRSIHLRPDDVLTGLYSPSVNGAIRDIFGALLNGATLLLFDLKREGLGHVATVIRQRRATILHAMPPVVRSLLGGLHAPDDLECIRLVYIAGDKLYPSDLKTLYNFLRPEALVYVGIGSTECATLYRQWFVPRNYRADYPLVPSGRPIPDRTVEILDSAGKPVTAGDVGRIVVSSPYLARGYWRDATRTRNSFSPLPDRPGWYQFDTGDMGAILPDGLLLFKGRADRQIKIRGHRVEPAGIEEALRGMRGVNDATVVAVQRGPDTVLIAFVASEEADIADELKSELQKLLPAHMRPAKIIQLNGFPLLSNFKVDTASLLHMAERYLRRDSSEDLTSSGVVEGCWREALKLSHVEYDRSFEDEGGDSLKALELHVSLEKALGRYLPLEGLRFGMTLSDLKLWLGNVPEPAADSSAKQRPQMFIFPAARGIEDNTIAVRDEMLSDMDVVMVDMPYDYKRAPYTTSIEDLATLLSAEVRSHYKPDRKMVFLGQCCGARIAHEIGTRLEAEGIKLDLLIAADVPLTADYLQ